MTASFSISLKYSSVDVQNYYILLILDQLEQHDIQTFLA